MDSIPPTPTLDSIPLTPLFAAPLVTIIPPTPTPGKPPFSLPFIEARPDRCRPATGSLRGRIVRNRFRITVPLGRGGMAMVYLARDVYDGGLFAVKVIRADRRFDEVFRRRFINEVLAVRRVRHPAVVRVLDVGELDDGRLFLVMEYVHGVTLRKLLRQGPLELDIAVPILCTVADGLHAAHQRGVIHRDLKPANVLIPRRPSPEAVARVVDFGIARIVGSPTITGCSDLVGTPLYIAPEQALGRDVDHRADIYALGVMMYRALTGRYPFAGNTREEVRAAVLQGKPPLPKDLDPEVPEPLQRICLKAMEVRPANRYHSAQRMADELRRFLEGRQVLARPTRYDAELHGRLQNHSTEIRAWREENLLSVVQMDRLLRPYWFMMGEDSPWIWLSQLFPWETVVIRLGGWLLLLSSLLWLGIYWSKLG
ncbi:MAG TPA: serine/threonine-protein kinase, partial [Polyangia bacterium]|nr:serine/threonine-protein kinase [Polyangia bacterium]